MAISTIDGIIGAISYGAIPSITGQGSVTGGSWYQPYQKQCYTGAYVAGHWYDMAPCWGMPPNETFPVVTSAGYSHAFLPFTNPGWMPIGGWTGTTVSPSIRNLVGAEMVTTSSTGVPAWFLLVDMLLYYPQVSLSASTASLTNTVTLSNMTYPRYTSGAGVMAYLEVTTGTLSATPTVYLTYTNSAGTGSRTTLASVVSYNANGSPQIVYSGTGANNYGPFFPLQAGDVGIQSVQSITLSGTTGAVNGALILCKPLAQIPITTQYIATGRDFVFNMPSMPIIYDGAYLNYLYLAGANTVVNSTFMGSLNYVWG